jgi:uncharacterized protein YggE
VLMTLIAIASFAAIQANPAPPQSGFKLVPVPARIEVTGYGEVKYVPDVASITYTIRGEGQTSDDAVRALTQSGARIEAELSIIDRAAEPHTSEVRIAVVRSTDCKEQEYGPPQLSAGACAIVGYVATQQVTLRTSAVKDAGTMVGLIGRAGGLNPRIDSFTVRDSRPQQQRAVAAAVADAEAKAIAIATASHVRLGPILNISSGPRNDAQQVVVTGRLAAVPPAPPPPPPVPVKVTPELLTTTSYISVTYEIDQ